MQICQDLDSIPVDSIAECLVFAESSFDIDLAALRKVAILLESDSVPARDEALEACLVIDHICKLIVTDSQTQKVYGTFYGGESRDCYLARLGSIQSELLRISVNDTEVRSETEIRSESVIPEKGVSLFDVAMQFEGDELAAKAWVNRLVDSKKLKGAERIGKCPNDGRASLYRWSEIFPIIENYLGLGPRERTKLFDAMKHRARPPKP